jgi:hypothetical protein
MDESRADLSVTLIGLGFWKGLSASIALRECALLDFSDREVIEYLLLSAEAIEAKACRCCRITW